MLLSVAAAQGSIPHTRIIYFGTERGQIDFKTKKTTIHKQQPDQQLKSALWRYSESASLKEPDTEGSPQWWIRMPLKPREDKTWFVPDKCSEQKNPDEVRQRQGECKWLVKQEHLVNRYPQQRVTALQVGEDRSSVTWQNRFQVATGFGSFQGVQKPGKE